MKVFRSTGKFQERPYYSVDDIEQMCIEELQNQNLFPDKPGPIRIERFIEKRFKINVEYGDLQDGILGYTEFGPNGVKNIVISRTLTEEDTKISERRINTTLAHETGHGLLHAHLFVLSQNPAKLFDNELQIDEPKILCRNTSIFGIGNKKTYDGRWWEYQANLVIGPILMPRALVIDALASYVVKRGVLETVILDSSRKEEAIRSLAETFEVNPIVAKIRLEAVYPSSQDNQLTL